MSWAQEEVGAAQLGDARRSRRSVRLVERLAEQPSAGIPTGPIAKAGEFQTGTLPTSGVKPVVSWLLTNREAPTREAAVEPVD